MKQPQEMTLVWVRGLWFEYLRRGQVRQELDETVRRYRTLDEARTVRSIQPFDILVLQALEHWAQEIFESLTVSN